MINRIIINYACVRLVTNTIVIKRIKTNSFIAYTLKASKQSSNSLF